MPVTDFAVMVVALGMDEVGRLVAHLSNGGVRVIPGYWAFGDFQPGERRAVTPRPLRTLALARGEGQSLTATRGHRKSDVALGSGRMGPLGAKSRN